MNPVNFIQQYCAAGGSLQGCIQGAYNMGVAIAIAVAFLYVVIGALQYMMGAAINTKEVGKKKIIGAIMGLVVIFVSGVVLYWINPQIFNAELIVYKITKLDVPKFNVWTEIFETSATPTGNYAGFLSNYNFPINPAQISSVNRKPHGKRGHGIFYESQFFGAVDIFTQPSNASVFAIADGTISKYKAAHYSTYGYGASVIEINHGNNYSVYAHIIVNPKFRTIGKKIQRGNNIGNIATNVNFTPHLHFQLTGLSENQLKQLILKAKNQ